MHLRVASSRHTLHQDDSSLSVNFVLDFRDLCGAEVGTVGRDKGVVFGTVGSESDEDGVVVSGFEEGTAGRENEGSWSSSWVDFVWGG